MLKRLFLFFICFACATAALAQGVGLTASIDKNALTLDDELTLTLEIAGASGNMLMPQLPSLPAFNVYSREVEQTTSNFQTITVFRYTLLPRFTGTATIGPISFTYANKSYQTDPMTVRVYRSAGQVTQQGPASSSARATAQQAQSNFDSASETAQQQAAREEADLKNFPPLQRALMQAARGHGTETFFLVSAVNNASPYVNQTGTLAVRFYYAQAFYDAPYSKPSVSNIFMEDLGSSQGTQIISGRNYRYQEQRYSITPAAIGKAEIGPAIVRYMVGNQAVSALDRLFGGAVTGEEKVAQSAPITLNVRPVPTEDKPQSFYGAVGTGFVMVSSTDHTQVEAGEAINLTISLKGPGNLKPTADIKLPAMRGFRVYDPASSSGFIPGADGSMQSHKTFKVVLVPAASGTYTLPAIPWSYFDPMNNQYRTLLTKPVSITVTPSTKTEAGFDFGSGRAVSDGFKTLGQDISYLKTSFAPQEKTFLEQAATSMMMNLLALALLVGAIIFALFGKQTLAQKRALATARARLKTAQTEEAVAQALSDYIEQKTGVNTSSLPIKEWTGVLQKRGASPATAQRVTLLWTQLEAARFAPVALGQESASQMAPQAQDLIKQLEGELK